MKYVTMTLLIIASLQAIRGELMAVVCLLILAVSAHVASTRYDWS
jgi:hypothetical protein